MTKKKKNPFFKGGTVATLCFGLVLCALVASGCSKTRESLIDRSDKISSDISITEYSFSKCKEEMLENRSTEITCDNRSLHITHKDILLNCGFETINITSLVNKDTIELNIEETPQDANCVCPVDISYSIGEFEKEIYVLLIKCNNQQIYCQTINF